MKKGLLRIVLFPLYILWLIHEKLIDLKIIRYWHYTEDGRIFKCKGMYTTFIKTPILKIEKRILKIKFRTYKIDWREVE